mgnify:CR=1 FL=1
MMILTLNKNMKDFLDSLHVLYKDVQEDPDLIWDKKYKRYVFFEGHHCSLKEFVNHIRDHGYEKGNLIVTISLDKDDDMGCTTTLVRHYKMQDMEIDVSIALDDYFIAPLVEYLREAGFKAGTCGVIEEILYEKEKEAL